MAAVFFPGETEFGKPRNSQEEDGDETAVWANRVARKRSVLNFQRVSVVKRARDLRVTLIADMIF